MNEYPPQSPPLRLEDTLVEGTRVKLDWLQRLAKAVKALGRSIARLTAKRRKSSEPDHGSCDLSSVERRSNNAIAVGRVPPDRPLVEQHLHAEAGVAPQQQMGGVSGQDRRQEPERETQAAEGESVDLGSARMFENTSQPRFEGDNQFKAAARDFNEYNLNLQPGVAWTITGSVLTAQTPAIPSSDGPSAQTSGKLISVVRHRPPSFQAVECEGGLTVSAIDDHDIPTISPDTLSNAEVYVRQLSPSRGLACWKPEPFLPFVGRGGVVPGDVGTYTAEDGFKKTFNLWDDALSITRSASALNESDYERPPNDVIHCQERMQVGDIVAEGVSKKLSISSVSGERRLSSCDFQCLSEQGAVLALTSPADLHEVADPVALHDWLLKHVRLICKFANRRRRIGPDDSLYIITGCIKGDQWALAAFKEPAEPPDHTLRLVRHDDENSSLYFWAEYPKCADARSSHAIQVGLKNQSLFLRGFRVSLSPEFHTKLDGPNTAKLEPPALEDAPGEDGPPGPGPHSGSRSGPPGHKETQRGGGDGHRKSTHDDYNEQGQETATYGLNLADGVKIDTFPGDRAWAYHPSETINRCILKLTRADIAISHDDEWVHCMEGSGWDEAIRNMVQNIRTHLTGIRIRHGVVILAPRQKRTMVALGHHLDYAFLCSVFIGCGAPALWNLNARFHVETFFFCIPTDWRSVAGGEPLSGLPQVHGKESQDATLEDLLDRPPSICHLDREELVVVSYGPCLPILDKKHGAMAGFSAWKSIFRGPPHPEAVLACCLWHVAHTVELLLEHIGQDISNLTMRVLRPNTEPFHHQAGGMDTNETDIWLMLVVLHLQGLGDQIEYAQRIFRESLFISRETASLLEEVARLKRAAYWLETRTQTRASWSVCQGQVHWNDGANSRRTEERMALTEGETKERTDQEQVKREAQRIDQGGQTGKEVWKMGELGPGQREAPRRLQEKETKRAQIKSAEKMQEQIAKFPEGEVVNKVQNEAAAKAQDEEAEVEVVKKWTGTVAAKARGEKKLKLLPDPTRIFQDLTSEVENIMRRATTESSQARQSMLDLQSLIPALCASNTFRQQLLQLKCDQAQWWLDVLQLVLNSDASDTQARSELLVPTLIRLSRDSGLHPQCLRFSHRVQMRDSPAASGGYGDVYRGSVGERAVAVKFLRISPRARAREEEITKAAWKEAILWFQLYHLNVLPCYGVLHDPAKPHRAGLISPWMINGDITEYLCSYPSTNRLLLLSDVASGINYLHGMNIVHGDLKGKNILISNSGRACLIDFAFSKLSDLTSAPWASTAADSSARGTARWQAPELFLLEGDGSDVKTTMKSDIYSYGCVCYEAMTGNVPFYEAKRDVNVMLFLATGRRPEKPHPTHRAYLEYGLTDAVWSFIETCWDQKPTLRPTAQELQQSPLFTSLVDNRPAQEWGGTSAAEFRRSIMPV